MNIAIVIGVSVYADSHNNLPGCKNDAEVINNILINSGKFNNVLYINESETSAQTKELITNFISTNSNTEIEELFFYYSGHGEFINDEFYYILSDFDSKKRNQTSLQNTEIDDLIRNISPSLVIKVIDACQSGTTYIKDISVINKYFNESKTSFKKCYFMSSSLNDQSSYQDKNISFFTSSFVKSIKNHTSSEIRYKDIIDVISDDFAETKEQTPFFVIQADYTERFCTIGEKLKLYLTTIDKKDSKQKAKHSSLVELVKKDATEYADKTEALAMLALLKDKFELLKLDDNLNDIYDINVKLLDDYTGVPQKKTIASWLEKNKGEYFTTTTYETVYDEYDNELEVISGFDLKLDTPFRTISVDVIGKHLNLTKYNCTIIFFLSKRYCRIFYCINNYIEQGWDSETLNQKNIKWVTMDFKIKGKDNVINAISTVKRDIQKRVMDELKEKYNIPEEEPETNNHPNLPANSNAEFPETSDSK